MYQSPLVRPTEVWHGTDLTVIPHGRGRLILSLFNIVEHLGNDPVADILLLNLWRWSATQDKPDIEVSP